MPYVMVPVPEEHVEAVMQFILRAISRASSEEWDGEGVTGLWDEIDESSRALLSFVARASAAGRELDIVDVARQLQVTPRETLAIVNELNTSARDANRPHLIVARVITERLPNGRSTDKRVLAMAPDLADVVMIVERAELTEAATLTNESSE